MAEVRSTQCENAQELLFRRHWFRLVASARRHTGEMHSAEDLASEAIVRTLRRLCAGAEISSFPRYAQMVVRNLNVDAHRGHLTLVLVDEFHDEAPDGACARDEISEVDLTLELAGLLDQLGARHQQILRLTVMEDVSTQVAAAIMGIKPNAAASLAMRARHALRAAYQRQLARDDVLRAEPRPRADPALDPGTWMTHTTDEPALRLVATDAAGLAPRMTRKAVATGSRSPHREL